LLRELIEQQEERFIELLSWREGTLSFYPSVLSGEEEVRTEAPAPALVTRGIREHYTSDELAILLGSAARAVLVRGDARGVDATQLGVSVTERRVLERAVPAGTLERLVAACEKEGLASVDDSLRAAFVALATGLVTAPSAGWNGIGWG
jgi:hypothetical protein